MTGCTQRGTKEVLNLSYHYETAYPVINATKRGISYKFMAAEAAYILSGRNDVEYLGKVLPHFVDFSDDGEYQAGAYGPAFIDQVPYVLRTLDKDRESRQAVISIWRARPYDSKDIPCTLTLQFLIRDDYLNTVVNMRSSDAFMGLIYDTFCFAMMSSIVAASMDVELGSTWINAGSSHIYEKDWNKAAQLIQDPGTILGSNRWPPLFRTDAIEVLEEIAESDKPLEGLLLAPIF